ncbi:hypothetical protein JX266_000662 [Neoarthrinium moseri]|nr:hypothetical protein JX266_000662 [Neoarthrinium moseri]
MSSLQTDTSPTIPAPSTPSDGPTSRSHSEKGDSPASHPAGLDSTASPAELLLSATKDARQIIRLVQCSTCSRILRDPITLPCGQTLCKTCIPETHLRTNISWPATANRLQGFNCPFEDCRKEHAIGDCSVDVTLNKVLDIVRTAVEQARALTEGAAVSTHVAIQNPWEVAGLPTLEEKDALSQVVRGGRIVSTYTLAETGSLRYECEVSYTAVGASEEEVTQIDSDAFLRLKECVRTEMDCQICYALYLDPFTTTCGHTFCRHCIHQVLSSSEHCPICRRALLIQRQVNSASAPANARLTKMINGFWADVVSVRAETVRAERQAELAGEYDIPIFVCTLAFPAMPTFLHVFEPRYRLMMRRVVDADRTFGMVRPERPSVAGGAPFSEIGTLLRIVNIEFFPDGRSLLETVGVSRFRVTRHGVLDGYVVGQVEQIDDVGLAEEEAMEISETMRGQGVQDFTQRGEREASATPLSPQSPATPTHSTALTLADLDTKSTRDLLDIGIGFVTRMRGQSVSWLAGRVLAVFGECPTDPTLFPWWFASVLPVSDDEKCRLLGTSSVRQRMKICCRWIVEWESSRW